MASTTKVSFGEGGDDELYHGAQATNDRDLVTLKKQKLEPNFFEKKIFGAHDPRRNKFEEWMETLKGEYIYTEEELQGVLSSPTLLGALTLPLGVKAALLQYFIGHQEKDSSSSLPYSTATCGAIPEAHSTTTAGTQSIPIQPIQTWFEDEDGDKNAQEEIMSRATTCLLDEEEEDSSALLTVSRQGRTRVSEHLRRSESDKFAQVMTLMDEPDGGIPLCKDSMKALYCALRDKGASCPFQLIPIKTGLSRLEEVQNFAEFDSLFQGPGSPTGAPNLAHYQFLILARGWERQEIPVPQAEGVVRKDTIKEVLKLQHLRQRTELQYPLALDGEIFTHAEVSWEASSKNAPRIVKFSTAPSSSNEAERKLFVKGETGANDRLVEAASGLLNRIWSRFDSNHGRIYFRSAPVQAMTARVLSGVEADRSDVMCTEVLAEFSSAYELKNKNTSFLLWDIDPQSPDYDKEKNGWYTKVKGNVDNLWATVIGAFVLWKLFGVKDRHQENFGFVASDEKKWLFYGIDFGHMAHDEGKGPGVDAPDFPIPQQALDLLVSDGLLAQFCETLLQSFRRIYDHREELIVSYSWHLERCCIAADGRRRALRELRETIMTMNSTTISVLEHQLRSAVIEKMGKEAVHYFGQSWVGQLVRHAKTFVQ